MSAVLLKKGLNKMNQNSLKFERHDFDFNRSNSNFKTISNEDLNEKMNKHIRFNSNSRNSEKRSEFSKSPQKSFGEDKEEPKDYVPFINKQFHVHNHSERKFPHLHTIGCERLMTAFDKQRDKRYYFTNKLTPVRVYIKYDKEHESAKKSKNSVTPSSNDYKDNKLPVISAKFLKETSTCRFIKETLSFIPISTRYSKNNLDIEGSIKSPRSDNTNNLRKMSNISDNLRKLSIISDKNINNKKSVKKLL